MELIIDQAYVKSNTLATWCEELIHWKRPWCWERLNAGEKGKTEDEMVGWHHRLNGHEFEQASGDGDGQGSLRCCSPWGCKELNTTEQLNNKKNISSSITEATFQVLESHYVAAILINADIECVSHCWRWTELDSSVLESLKLLAIYLGWLLGPYKTPTSL